VRAAAERREARARSAEKVLESRPELEPRIFDPYDVDGLARLIRDTIVDRERALALQLASFERMMQSRTWAEVAADNGDAVTGNTDNAPKSEPIR
jgi:hypothetical protein